MYCHKCGTLMPEDSLFCRKCGARLIAGAEMPIEEPTPIASGQSGIQERKGTRQSCAKHRYYQKLVGILAESGFRTDPRLVEREDLFESIPDWAMKVGQVGVSTELGPIAAALTEPLAKFFCNLAAVGSEELYSELADIASLFKIVAVKYRAVQLVVFAVIDADKLDLSQAEFRASALCNAMSNLFRPKMSLRRWLKNLPRGAVSAVCLYVFFDEKRSSQMASLILKKCYKLETNIIPTLVYQVEVQPLVANVPAKKFDHKKARGLFMGEGWVLPVSKEKLAKAF